MAFKAGTRVRVKTAPDKVGTLTGRMRERAGRTRYEVDFGAEREYITESNLEEAMQTPDIFALLQSGRFGSVVTLRSALTHTRLTGRLADVIYSMEASDTEFLPYQFKPVLNFLDSPSRGILIADEVGLGKTIEAGLIWTELRARFNASKLLVICPAVLREKWQDELSRRFGVKADICSAMDLYTVLKRFRAGNIDDFAVIVSMQGARPPKGWDEQDTITTGAAELARQLSGWEPDRPAFDCVIVDEAHYLRNPHTQLYALARLVREISEYLLLLSATPIHLRSDDLFFLLSLIDGENFRYTHAFKEILTANAPLVALADDLRRKPMSQIEFRSRLTLCQSNPMLKANRQLTHLACNPPDDATLTDPVHRERYADKIQRTNLLSRIVSRTRKRDVQKDRAIRDVLAPTVTMTAVERDFYLAVTESVRRYCADGNLSEAFILTIPQRQMCSSIPAAFRAWRSKSGLRDDDSLYENALPDDDIPETDLRFKNEAGPLVRELSARVADIASYPELKDGDSKYRVLIQKLRDYWSEYPDKKVILFAYYRETLRYLHERLSEDGIPCVLLLGGMRESKQLLIEKFTRDMKSKILLASEVASEGVDLQFSSFLINYDLPWNPMRVEQRIGRIDRIGQTEHRIHIWNFFYADTLDDRVYHRLFLRLGVFRHAFGDIEAVLGERIQELSLFLLSHNLTPDQEAQRIEQTQVAIAREAREQEELEEEAVHLAAHSDYVLRQVSAARELQRYIHPESLWSYIRDSLLQDFPGTEVIRVTDDPLTADVALSRSARVELQHFVDRNRMHGKTRLVQLDGRTRCVFSNRTDFSTAKHEVIDQHHPLVRFVSQRLSEEIFHPLVAARLPLVDARGMSEGTYLITAQRWSTTGARTVERLVFKGIDFDSGAVITDKESEILIGAAVQAGEDWPASRSAVDTEIAVDRYETLLDSLDQEFGEYAVDMSMENNDRVDHLIRTLTDKIQSQIAQNEAVISRLAYERKEKTIPARRGKIKKLEEYLGTQCALFEKKRAISSEQRNVMTVVLYVGTQR